MLNGNLDRYFIGADAFAKRMAEIVDAAAKCTTSNYPPYNIKRIGENRYLIEMAVAGFAKQDIEIELTDDKLVIKGNVSSNDTYGDTETPEWPSVLYRGLAMRSFTRTFHVGDKVEITNASLVNGILKVFFDQILPEHKTTKIEIQDTEEK